jgi:hypothetical protein
MTSAARPGFPRTAGPPGGPFRSFNHRATIIWHTAHMPDEYRLTPPRPDPERIDLAAIKTDLEFAIRVHKQLARTALGIIFSTSVVTTIFDWWLLVR